MQTLLFTHFKSKPPPDITHPVVERLEHTLLEPLVFTMAHQGYAVHGCQLSVSE